MTPLGLTVSKVAQYRQYQGIGVVLSHQAGTAGLMHIHQAIARESRAEPRGNSDIIFSQPTVRLVSWIWNPWLKTGQLHLQVLDL